MRTQILSPTDENISSLESLFAALPPGELRDFFANGLETLKSGKAAYFIFH